MSRQGIDPHPTQPGLHTVCLVAQNLEGFMGGSSTFKLKRVHSGKAHRSRSSKAAYLKVRQHGFSPGEGIPAREVYFHWVLCFMFRGPCPQGTPHRVMHVCDNKLCLAPWHLQWGDQSTNMKAYHVHKRHRTQYLL